MALGTDSKNLGTRHTAQPFKVHATRATRAAPRGNQETMASPEPGILKPRYERRAIVPHFSGCFHCLFVLTQEL
jgi:hypothetical protein